MKTPTVGFISEPWGYGATALLFAISDQMSHAVKKIFIGTGVSAELARRQGFDDLWEFDTSITGNAENGPDQLRDLDLGISAMNVPATALLNQVDVPCIFVDGMAWLWGSPFGGTMRFGQAQPAGRVVRYFVEDFPGIREKLASWPQNIGWEVVGPIIQRPADIDPCTPPGENAVLVSVGGLDSKLMPPHTRDAYLTIVTRLIDQLVERRGADDNLLVAGGETAMARMRSLSTRKVRCYSLPHQEFLRRLSSSRVLISAAGLRTMYESFAREIPTAFLPPQNMSQELTVGYLRAAGAAPCALQWRDTIDVGDIEGMSQPDACHAINQAIETASGNSALLCAYEDQLCDFVLHRRPGVARQRAFLRERGADGGQKIAEFALTFLGH